MRRIVLVVLSVGVALVAASASSSSQAGTQGRWVIRDLRAGPRSEAYAINDRGQVLWHRWSTTHNSSVPFIWENGRSVRLTLGGRAVFDESGSATAFAPVGQANAINERGQVVGWSCTRDDAEHAFLWENGKITDLGTLGGWYSEALAVNELGQVVGSADTKKAQPLVAHAFLWENGTMRDLGTLGGRRSQANAVNGRGQVVGWAETGKKDSWGHPVHHAFLWQNGKMRDLTPRDKWSSAAVAINERGQIAGVRQAVDAGDVFWDAFLWQSGTMHVLRPPPSAPRRHGVEIACSSNDGPCPRTINERGQVTGSWGGNAVIWQNGRIRVLGRGHPSAINERGKVVGQRWIDITLGTGADHAWLWEGGTGRDLGVLLGKRYENSGAVDVNNRGQIVGVSAERAVLWTYKP